MAQIIVPHKYRAQERGYTCGPSSTRMVLTTFGKDVSEAQLARECGTTTNGTNDINSIRPVLKRHTGRDWDRHGMPNDPPTAAQIDLLRRTIMQTVVQERRGFVANIVAPPGNNLPGYPGNYTVYHYLTVMGTDTDRDMQYLADPARFGGHEHYWVTTRKLASLIPPKAWAALANVAPPPPKPSPLAEALAQLVGPIAYQGWPQLGGRTLVDAIAELERRGRL